MKKTQPFPVPAYQFADQPSVHLCIRLHKLWRFSYPVAIEREVDGTPLNSTASSEQLLGFGRYWSWARCTMPSRVSRLAIVRMRY